MARLYIGDREVECDEWDAYERRLERRRRAERERRMAERQTSDKSDMGAVAVRAHAITEMVSRASSAPGALVTIEAEDGLDELALAYCARLGFCELKKVQKDDVVVVTGVFRAQRLEPWAVDDTGGIFGERDQLRELKQHIQELLAEVRRQR